MSVITHRRPRSGALLVALTLTLTALLSAGPASANPRPELPGSTAAGQYVVTLSRKPVASYAGEITGLAATKPARGRTLASTSAPVAKYKAYLQAEQQRIAAKVGVRPTHSYAMAFNGFTAKLTGKQVQSLRRTPGVLSVVKDTLRVATDDRSAVDQLRLSGTGGTWAGLGGTAKAGKGVVIGVLDSGVWPESASFAGAALKTTASADPYLPYRSGSSIVVRKNDGGTFTGTCQTGERFTAALCNTKLVGARYFGEHYFSEIGGVGALSDFQSPRDTNGHGTHTASTAAGKAAVPVSINGLAHGSISGVAPAATVAAYKVLWNDSATGTAAGSTADIVAGIDAAVTDGVDVLNYSIGNSVESNLDDPVQIALLNAVSAGVFVAASAGNYGPDASTVDNAAPWLTTVAASTLAPLDATIELGNGARVRGVSSTVGTSLTSRPLVAASAATAAGRSSSESRICLPGSLEPTKISGRIVLCERGATDRVEKSAVVKAAGGAGVVLLNISPDSLDADAHSLPTVHVDSGAATTLKSYAATAGATASLVAGDTTGGTKTPYPQIASFSSRGPSLVNTSDLLKPDLAAPGTAILAATAPPNHGDQSFAFDSGTSMAAPHISGLAALYFGKHPTWSPMAIKSAMMTTAVQTKTASGAVNKDVYAQGAGLVNPSRMFDPGVVIDAGDDDWYGYLKGQGAETSSDVPAIDPSNYNAPSVAIGQLYKPQTVTRRVTAIKAGAYKVAASVPGVTATVSPSVLTFAHAGQVETVKVTFTRTTAPFDVPAVGQVTIIGEGTAARLPVAVTPKRVVAPAKIVRSGASGSITYPVEAGFAGTFAPKTYGLTAGPAVNDSVTEAEQFEQDYTVAASTRAISFSVRSATAGADVDLLIYHLETSADAPIAYSLTSSANETVTLVAPAPGTYVAVVAGYTNADGTETTPFSLRAARVTTAAANLTISPTTQTVAIGKKFNLTASWSGLAAGVPYAGLVTYPDGSSTVVEIN